MSVKVDFGTSAESLPLGLLDLGERRPGQTVTEHLAEVLRLATVAESLGYSRYWLAEHHAPRSSWASPVVMAAAIAQQTRTIRVGPAGVLLSAYNPFRLACDFAVLTQLFPGRMDLGIARARPAMNSAALDDHGSGDPPSENGTEENIGGFTAKLVDLLGHLSDNLPVEHRHFGAVVVPPVHRPGFETWLLGSNQTTSSIASRRGTPLALALFLNPDLEPAVASGYRTQFQPGWTDAPHLALAVAGVCAPTEHQASQLVAQASTGPIRIGVSGCPAGCAERLRELGRTFGADEIVWVDAAPGADSKRESMTLLRAAWGNPTTT